MKRCPNCNRTYTDLSLNFCLEDGTPLVSEVAPPPELNATVRYQAPRTTNEPPPTEIYRASPVNQVPGPARPPQWAPVPPALVMPGPTRRKSNAIWWILGGFAVVAIIGIGLVVMILALASMSSNTNENANANSNSRIVRSNSNTNVNANINSNSNAADSNTNAALPASVTDNFST